MSKRKQTRAEVSEGARATPLTHSAEACSHTLQVDKLFVCALTAKTSSACPGRSIFSFFVCTSQTFIVESLLLLTMSRESALQHTWYTACTCARKDVMNLPVCPFHSFTLLSNEADAMYRPSGEKQTKLTGCWCPVMRRIGFLLLTGSHSMSVKELLLGRAERLRVLLGGECEHLLLLGRSGALVVERPRAHRVVGVETHRVDPVRVSLERAHELAGVDRPHLDRAVLRARVQQVLAAPPEAVDRLSVTAEAKHTLTANDVPDLEE
jgi:hypothetical protein